MDKLKNNKIIKKCINYLFNNIIKYNDNEDFNNFKNIIYNKEILLLNYNDYDNIIYIKFYNDNRIEISYDEEYEYIKTIFRLNHIDYEKISFKQNNKNFYIIKNILLKTIYLIDIINNLEKQKDKKINQCIAVCKNLNKSSFKRPFNLTEDIMNCY